MISQTEKEYLSSEPQKSQTALIKAKKARGTTLALEINELRGRAKTTEDYLLLQQKLKALENLFKHARSLNIEGELNEQNHLLLKYHTGSRICCTNITSSGNMLAVGTLDGKIIVLSLAEISPTSKPQVLLEHQADNKGINAISFSPDEHRIAIGYSSGVAYTLSLPYRNLQENPTVLSKHKCGKEVLAIKSTVNGEKVVFRDKPDIFIASLSQQNGINPQEKILYKLTESKYGSLFTACFNSQGDKVAIGGHNNTKANIVIISLSDCQNDDSQLIIALDRINKTAISAINFSFGEENIATGGLLGEIDVYSLYQYKNHRPVKLAQFETQGIIRTVNFSPEGDKLIVGGDKDNSTYILSLENLQFRKKARIMAKFTAESSTSAAEFTPQGDKIVIGSSDGTVRVFGERE